MIAVNGRYLVHRTTGVQRYALNVVAALEDPVNVIRPKSDLTGWRGHLWEQLALPRAASGDLLFSPSGTGPVSYPRQVVTVHDVASLDHPEWFSRGFRTIYRALVPRLIKRCLRVITVSEFSRNRLLERVDVPPEKIVAIPNGVEPHYAPPDAATADAIRRKFADGKPYVLSVGSLEPRKNLRGLFLAWEKVYQPGGPELLIAGASGKSFSGLGFDRVPAGVKVLGYVDDADLPGLYGAALAFTYVSLYEGFGLPPLEAMACGTPVVCSSTTALPEVVGDAALPVNPEDPESVAQGLRRIIKDERLRNDLSRKGLERATFFSWKRTAELTQAVLREAARN